jgi:molecular chaperone DnaK
MKEALKEAGLQPDDIDKVLLVGGSSRIPYIVQRMKDFTGKEPSKEVNPDEAVAIGAALYANMNVNNDKERQFTDVCSHSIGVVVINDDSCQEENEVIIKRNTKLPTEVEQRFRTMEKNQKMICLTITEGEYKELTDVTIIGNVDINLPPQLPQNTRILLTISLDRHQLINIRFEVPDRNFKQEYQMQRIANMDEDEVRHVTGMLRDYTVS